MIDYEPMGASKAAVEVTGPTAWPDQEPEPVDRWTIHDQDNAQFTSALATIWDDTGHIGELWLDGDGDYEGQGSGKVRKPPSSRRSAYCGCGFPLPVRRKWKTCEFDGPQCIRRGLDDDPLLYRIASTLWTFCACNGCVGTSLKQGRPPAQCTKCARDTENAQRRERYRIVTSITSEKVEKPTVFVG